MKTKYIHHLAEDIHSINPGINDRRVINYYYENNQPKYPGRQFDKSVFYHSYMNIMNPVTGHIHRCKKLFRRYLLFMYYYLNSSSELGYVTYEEMTELDKLDLKMAPLLTLHMEDIFPKIYLNKYKYLRSLLESHMADYIDLTLDFYSSRINSVVPFDVLYDLCFEEMKPKPYTISYYNEDGSINRKKQNQFTNYYNQNLSTKISYIFTYPSPALLSPLRYLFLFLMLSKLASSQEFNIASTPPYFYSFYDLSDDILLDLLEDEKQVELFHTCKDTYIKYNLYYHANSSNIFNKDSKLL